MSEREIAVKVQDLTKSFRIPLEASNGIKQKLINTLKGRKGYRDFTPLNDISFEIEKGDFFGIVGRNGSGKSTLLKTIAGIYTPNKGAVHVNGTLVPFIELGVGFNPELTGRENVFLNGALLGFSHDEMEAMYDDIVKFAELEEFMDERLKNYSSGMQVRLAFSIAIRAEGDILLLDEVLAVGDEAFQKKCIRYFRKLKQAKRTVILVTHDMNSVRQYCNRAMLIDNGRIVKVGSPKEVSEMYSNLFEFDEPEEEPVTRWGEGALKIKAVVAESMPEGIKLNINLTKPKKINEKVIVAYTIKSSDGYSLSGNHVLLEIDSRYRTSTVPLSLVIPCNLNNGKYYFDVSIRSQGSEEYFDVWLDCASVKVREHSDNPLPLSTLPTLVVPREKS